MSARSSMSALCCGVVLVSALVATANEASAALVNVAQGGSATQSSNYSSSAYLAPNAVDENYSNFTHTNGSTSDQNPWWQVDMGAEYRLGEVVLYNRGDGSCPWRLRDITVDLLAGDGSTVVYSSSLLNAENGAPGAPNNPTTLTVDLNALTGGAVNAQFVRVSRTGDPDSSGAATTPPTGTSSHDNFVLSLGEVQAMTKVALTGGTAPGGFIEAGSGSNLLYHLDAAKGVTLNGSAVTDWADQGPAGNDFSQSDPNKQPTRVPGALGGNNLPAVRFDGDNSDPDGTGSLLPGAYADELVLNSSTSARTVFIVNSTFQHRGLDGIWGRYASDYGIRRESSNAWQDPGNANDFSNSGSMYVNGALTDAASLNTPHILTAVGTASYPATSLGNYFAYGHPAGARSWNGDIGEVIVFDRQLNLAEIRVIENHLSAKYDIPLADNDFYVGDDAMQGDYDLDVFGAGRVDASNLLYEAGSAGMGIELSDASLGDGEFLLAGHETPTNSWVTADLPMFADQRWDRVWYVDKTGNLDATLSFGLADGGLPVAPPAAEHEFVLLYSPTNAFEFSILDWDADMYMERISFNLTNRDLLDGYYTLATARVPEPASSVLIGLGALLLLPMARRRKPGAR